MKMTKCIVASYKDQSAENLNDLVRSYERWSNSREHKRNIVTSDDRTAENSRIHRFFSNEGLQRGKEQQNERGF